MRDVRQRTQRELSGEPASARNDEIPPHVSARRVIREREINLTIEEFFEFFLGSLLGITGTPNYRDSRLVIDEFGSPLT